MTFMSQYSRLVSIPAHKLTPEGPGRSPKALLLNLWSRKGLRYAQIALLISFSAWFAKFLSAVEIASLPKSQPLRVVDAIPVRIWNNSRLFRPNKQIWLSESCFDRKEGQKRVVTSDSVISYCARCGVRLQLSYIRAKLYVACRLNILNPYKTA